MPQIFFLKPVLWRLVIIHIRLWNPLPVTPLHAKYLKTKNIEILDHFGRDEDRTIGVRPRVKRFLVLLKLTMLKMIRWSTCTLSTEKLNQNLTIRRSQC